jgi:hypothetical protein
MANPPHGDILDEQVFFYGNPPDSVNQSSNEQLI